MQSMKIDVILGSYTMAAGVNCFKRTADLCQFPNTFCNAPRNVSRILFTVFLPEGKYVETLSFVLSVKQADYKAGSVFYKHYDEDLDSPAGVVWT